jgi:transposase-like protein
MSSDDNCVRIHDYSIVSDNAAKLLKNVAKDSRESTSSSIELIRTLLRTGTIEELIRTILETTNAIQDTANEVSSIIRDLKEAGAIKKTVNTVVETTNIALTTIEIAKNISIGTNEASKTTSKE